MAIIKKSPEQIEQMAAAGDVLVKTMNLLASKIRPGVTTLELDQAAEKFIRSQGCEPAFKGYRGFPGSICASPNSMVVHGIPGAYRLERGDILSVDIGVVKDGWVADAARTFPVGPVSPIAQKLLAVTEEACSWPCRSALPETTSVTSGTRSSTTSRMRTASRSCVPWSGTGSAARCTRIRRFPTTASRAAVCCWRRGWCWRSSRWSTSASARCGWLMTTGRSSPADGTLAAHFEFTIAVTADGPRVLTPWHEATGGRAAA